MIRPTSFNTLFKLPFFKPFEFINLFKGGGDGPRHYRPTVSSSRSRGMQPEEQPHIGHYRILKTIGKGNFAKVKLARHVLTGREVGCFVPKLLKFSNT